MEGTTDDPAPSHVVAGPAAAVSCVRWVRCIFKGLRTILSLALQETAKKAVCKFQGIPSSRERGIWEDRWIDG